MPVQQSDCIWLVWNGCMESLPGAENQSGFLSMMSIAGGVMAAMKIASPQIYAQIVRIPETPQLQTS